MLELERSQRQDGHVPLRHVLRRQRADLREVDTLDGGEEVHNGLERPALELPVRPIGDHGDHSQPLGLGEALHTVADLESPHLPHNVPHYLHILRPCAFEEAQSLLVFRMVFAILQQLGSIEEVHRGVFVARHQNDGLVGPIIQDHLLKLLQQGHLARWSWLVLRPPVYPPVRHLILRNLQDQLGVGDRPPGASDEHVEVLHRSHARQHVGVRDVARLDPRNRRDRGLLGGLAGQLLAVLPAALLCVVPRSLAALDDVPRYARASVDAAHQPVAKVTAIGNANVSESPLPCRLLGVRPIPGDLAEHVPD
mmetsp:Transcript_11689/g.26659  ORF Transcript_11689/g.26659 Transcript_11689/m.26659 type:complete len:309 (-) Transcript_11689:247-1173(-)